MDDSAKRLIQARERAGYTRAADAAAAMGVAAATYHGHENGSRGLGRSAQRYADFFGVSLDWLLRGKGEPPSGEAKPAPPDRRIARPYQKTMHYALTSYALCITHCLHTTGDARCFQLQTGN